MSNIPKTAGVLAPAVSQKLLFSNQLNLDLYNYRTAVGQKTRKIGKVIKLFRCIGCGKSYSTRKMSSLLVICKGCLLKVQIDDEKSRNRFAEKIERNFIKYLRGRLCG